MMATYARSLVKDFQRNTIQLAQAKATFLRAQNHFDEARASFNEVKQEYTAAKQSLEKAEILFEETIRTLVMENIDVEILKNSVHN